MDSPPSNSGWSEAFILSDDSGLLLTNSSISSSSICGDNRPHCFEFQDSDCEDKSFSLQDSLDGMSDIMCGENFNTLKKGQNWTEFSMKDATSPIEPPLEFQDKPSYPDVEFYSEKLSKRILRSAVFEYKDGELRRLKLLSHLNRPIHYHHQLIARQYWGPDFIPFSPCHSGRPGSRCSLGSSRLSSSHNSLSVPTGHKVDDSSFITQAVSHDTLSTNQISDLYNVPFDSDVYAVPIDVIRPPLKPKRGQQLKKKRRNTSSSCREIDTKQYRNLSNKKYENKNERFSIQNDNKRHSVAGTSAPIDGEPIHMTLQEVRQYLQTLYSSSSDSSEHKDKICKSKTPIFLNNNNKFTNSINNNNNNNVSNSNNNISGRSKKNTFLINIKNKKVKDSCDNVSKQISVTSMNKTDIKRKKTPARFFSLKQTLCNMFRFKRFLSPEHVSSGSTTVNVQEKNSYISNSLEEMQYNYSYRALPPLPSKNDDNNMSVNTLDFATSIQRVKDYGWYWGPLSSEAAEKILSNEPDGSFIVRDSSDDHYIFSLTFKLNNCVRHVRIDHDQGNFSFGSCTKFKSQTIVEFIENAVEHSRSGRYLFFLHRRPTIGPVRVQLLHPLSRFKQVQSLQHICRFVIHKVVRRDLIPSLPLPRRMIDYLNTPHYYSEHLIDIDNSADDTKDIVGYNTNTITNSNTSENRYEENVQNINLPNDNVPVNYVVLNNTISNFRQS